MRRGKGLDGGADVFVATDFYSGLRAAYIAPDKSADSTTMALRMFAGNRTIHKLYAEGLGNQQGPEDPLDHASGESTRRASNQ